MIKVTVQSKNGLHARPASVLVKKAAAYEGDITLFKGDKSANAKSIMKVMGLGLQCGDEVCIEASGEGAEQMEKELATIIEEADE